MKIYLIDYNIDEREPKKIFVSQYSSYKIGINVNGVDNSKIKFSKKSDGKPIAVEEEFKGYNTYSFEASTPETTYYNIWVPYSNTGITFTLEVITTDSTVAELSSGGGMPTDLELNSLKVSGTLSVDGSNVYLKGNDLDVRGGNVQVIHTANDIYDYSTGGYKKGIKINCDILNVGNSIETSNNCVINTNQLNSNNIQCNNDLRAPSLTCSMEQGTGLLSFAAMADDVRFMGNAISFFSQGNLEFNGVTTLVFNFDQQGNLLKAVPRNITDSSGNTYTVLALEPMS